MKPKAFLEALELFSTNPKKSRSYLEDLRLSQEEKTILKGFFLFKKKENDSLASELLALPPSNNEIVEAQKNLLIGLVYNEKNEYQKALKHFKLAQPAFEKNHLQRFVLLCYLNCFIIHLNLKNLEGMKKTIHKLRVFPAPTPLDKTRVLNCLFSYYCYVENYEEAKKALKDLKHMTMSQSDEVALLINQFCLNVKMEQFEDCYKQLDELKQFKNFNHTENFNFMKKLLDHYVHGEPIYLQDQKLKDLPFQYSQLSVIKCLEEGDLEAAKKHWQYLQKLNPEIYQDDFKYLGDKTIFSLNLEKWKKNYSDKKIIEKVEFSGGDISEKIISLLSSATAPLRKEKLYELVFNTQIEDKADLQRLAKNIYKIKKKSKLNIIYKKGCYSLEK